MTSVSDVYLAIASNFWSNFVETTNFGGLQEYLKHAPVQFHTYCPVQNLTENKFKQMNFLDTSPFEKLYWVLSFFDFVIFRHFWKKSFEKGWKYFFLNFSLLQKCSVDHGLSFDMLIEALWQSRDPDLVQNVKFKISKMCQNRDFSFRETFSHLLIFELRTP